MYPGLYTTLCTCLPVPWFSGYNEAHTTSLLPWFSGYNEARTTLFLPWFPGYNEARTTLIPPWFSGYNEAHIPLLWSGKTGTMRRVLRAFFGRFGRMRRREEVLLWWVIPCFMLHFRSFSPVLTLLISPASQKNPLGWVYKLCRTVQKDQKRENVRKVAEKTVTPWFTVGFGSSLSDISGTFCPFR